MFEIKNDFPSFKYIIDYPKDYPKDYNENEKYPVVFYIHGTGMVNKGAEAFSKCCPVRRERMNDDMPFIIVAPTSDVYWIEIFEQLMSFIEFIRQKDYADKNKIYITGSSMGGYTSWNLLVLRPDWFAAAVICCGAGMYFAAKRIKTPVIAVHGEKDTVVLPRESQIMVDRINASGGNAKLILYPDLEHDVWTRTFKDKEIYEWLLNN